MAMNAEALLEVIRRDVGEQIQLIMQFKLPHDFAQNLKVSREIGNEITSWVDNLCKSNLLAGYNESGYEGTIEDWRARCMTSEAKLDQIKGVLNG